MSSSIPDVKLAEALLDTEWHHTRSRFCARLASKTMLLIMLATGLSCATLLRISSQSKGSTLPLAEKALLFYNTSSTWRAPEFVTFAKGTAASTMTEEYYWERRGRTPSLSSAATYIAPSDFSGGPSWVWKNENYEQMRHSPLIDNDMNIYLSTTSRIRKFSPDGELLWTFQTTEDEGILTASPTLHEDAVVGVTTGYFVVGFSLKMSDGSVNWKTSYSVMKNGNADSVVVANGVLLWGGCDKAKGPGGMPDRVNGANASDGTYLWEYIAGDIFWNFSPSVVGDGTIIFSSTLGTVFRLCVKDGKLIYKVGPSHPGKATGVAGGALGPNGLFYAAYNKYSEFEWQSGNSFFTFFDQSFNNDGYIAAYQVSDGSLVWRRSLQRRTGNYPSVGMLDGRLAVVVPVGDNPLFPMSQRMEKAVLFFHPTPGYLEAGIIALDATDGKFIWQSWEPKWPHIYTQGDMEMVSKPRPPWPPENTCFPDPSTMPVILGDSTVYHASSHGGWLRAIRDANGDGVIDPSEIKVFDAGFGWLNSPSMAPGMLVAAPCWGDMNIFKS